MTTATTNKSEVASTKPEVVASKSQQTLTALLAGLRERGDVKMKQITVTPDGKFTNVKVGEAWPLIVIGPGGGIGLPQIKSYPEAMKAALTADRLWAAQIARDAKKAQASVKVAPGPAKKAGAKAPVAKKATVTERKAEADQKLEAKLDVQAPIG